MLTHAGGLRSRRVALSNPSGSAPASVRRGVAAMMT